VTSDNKANQMKMKTKISLPMEIEIQTADLWLASSAIKVSQIGNENTYYINEFGHEFMCKNYPKQ